MNRCTSGVILLSIVFLTFGCSTGSDKQPTKPSARSGEPKIKSGEMITSSPGGDKQPTKPSARSTKGENEKSKVGSPGGVASSLAEYTNSIGMKFKLIPAGEFMMGSPASEKDRGDDEGPVHRGDDRGDDEGPVHRVRITKPYYLGTYEVTQSQFEKVMGTSPWEGKSYAKEGADYAASYVSWDDAVEFCKKLSTKEGRTYRLPTEAEWEYACRAGSKTAYSFGADSSNLGTYAWYDDNAYDVDEKYAHRVGQKRANDFGLHDMHGNVWEWCQDWYGEDYYENSPASDPTGPTKGVDRVFRGGGWCFSAKICRSANRSGSTPGARNYYLGFRVALVPSE